MIDPNVKKILLMLTGAVDMLARGRNGDHEKVRQITSKVLNLIAEKPSKKKPAEAAPVAPLPWFVRRRDDKTVVATFLNVVYAGDYHRVILGDSDTFEVAAAPPVVAVGFGGATGRAMLESGERATQTGPEGWSAEVSPDRKWLAIYVGLRPGEDAGETLAKMLAPVGRGL